MRLRLERLRRASLARGLARAERLANAQAAARVYEPSRVAADGAVRPQGGMERLLAALKRALYAQQQHAAHAHSHFAPTSGASWRQLYTVRCGHAWLYSAKP